MFMDYEVTDKQTWILIDGDAGVTYVPEDVSHAIAAALNQGFDAIAEDLASHFYDGMHIYSVELTEGYGARLSASGYMDCTPWDVFDTQKEAEQYLRDEYPHDEEDSDDSADL